MPNSPKNIKITLVYARQDKKYSLGLKKHLNALTYRHKNIDINLVDDLPFGDLQQNMRELLQQSDILLLLLSIDFLEEHILNTETRTILDVHKQSRRGERVIVPIIVRAFNYDMTFGEYQFQNLDFLKSPIATLEDREDTYQKIVDALDEDIKRFNAKAIKIALPTWVGYLSAINFNKGLERNKETTLYKKFKRNVRIELNDNHDLVLEAWKAGEVDLVGVTLDALPNLLEQYGHLEPQIIFQASWSAGADAIVVRNGVEKIADLQNKKVICSPNTPSHYFLKHVLNEANISEDEVWLIDKGVTTPDDAVRRFKEDKSIDAVVLWSPFLESCLHDVSNTKILTSTKSYPNLITDVIIATKSYIQLNQEELTELFKGWLLENKRFGVRPETQNDAVNIFIDGIIKPLPALIPNRIRQFIKETLVEYFESAVHKIHLCSYEDNILFFGENGVPPLGKVLFSGYEGTEKEWTWEDIIDDTIIKQLKGYFDRT